MKSRKANGESWPEKGEFKIEERGDGSFWLFRAVTISCADGVYYDWEREGEKHCTRDAAVERIKTKVLENIMVRQEVISVP